LALRRLESRLQASFAQDLPDGGIRCDSFQRLGAERVEFESFPDQAACRRVDENAAGRCQRRQARGERRRRADRDFLPGGAFSKEVSDHDEAGCNAGAHLQLDTGQHVQPAYGAHGMHCGLSGGLGRMLRGKGIAEIRHQPVAQQPRNLTVEPRDRRGAGIERGIDDRPHVLELKLARESRRIHEIADQDRHLPTLGSVGPARTRLRSGNVFGRPKPGNGPHHFFAMTEGDPEPRQILIGQFRKDIEIDGLLGKQCPVLTQSK